MAFNLKVKTNTAAPASGALSVGELGYNKTTRQVFIGNGAENNATPIIMAVEGTNIANVDGIKLLSTFSGAGNIFFSDYEGVPQVTLSENVTMAIGIDSVLKAYNYTGATLTDGQFVYDNGNQDGATTIALARADNLISSLRLIGCITEPIENEDFGFISRGGYVNNIIIDPAIFTAGDIIYLSPTVAGGFTNQKPTAPNYITELGFIDLTSTNSSTADGRIFVKINIIPLADDISYDNSDAFLNSQTVKGALDELSLNKVDVGALSSNISLYPTTATSDISGYYRMVSSTEDADYNDTAVNVATGSITTTNQLISSLVADPNLFVGNPGVINITTLGNVRKTAGNPNAYAEFFFRIYHRTAAGVETLAATSGTTGAVNGDINDYEQFSASANFSNGTFTSTDRIVIKYYANMLGGSGSAYDFQFGGTSPVRTLLPVPVSVIPTPLASAIISDVSNFNGILSSANGNVQSALETIDDHNHDNRYVNLTGDTMTGDLTIQGDLNVAGTMHIIDTDTQTTEQIIITNDGTGPALIVNQTGVQPVMDIQDDGTSVLYVADGGNVGIGTTSPTEKLDVNGNIKASVADGSVAVKIKTLTASQASLDLASLNKSYRIINNSSSLRFYDQSNDVDRVNITSDGKVGIGTISPSAKLHVVGQDVNLFSDTATNKLSIGRNSNEYLGIEVTDNDANITYNQDADGDADVNFTITSAGTGSRAFRFNNDLSVSGNVGIGTTSPSVKLVIQKDTTISGLSTNTIVKNKYTGTSAIGFGPTISFQTEDTGYNQTKTIAYIGAVNEKVGSSYDTQDGRIVFGTMDEGSAATEKMTILSSGNVGIGTTSPTEKLDVTGNVKTSGRFMYGTAAYTEYNSTDQTIDFVFN